MNWNGNRFEEEFIFVRVDKKTAEESDRYNWITKGSIEYATSSDLKVTGKFDFTGYELPNQNDLIRIKYKFKQGSEVETTTLATLFCSYSSIEYIDTLKGLQASGTLDGSSVLSILKNRKIGYPKVVKRGTNAVYAARDLIQDCDLWVSVKPGYFKLTDDYTFKEGTTYLDMVNTLLGLASFKEVYCDVNGYCILEPLEYPHTGISFVNNDESIMYPELEQSNDWINTPNVVKVLYNTDSSSMLATAKNLSGSRASLDNRFEITYTESISSIEDSSALKQKAIDILKDKSCDIEYVKFDHALVPVNLYDNVHIRYSDLEWDGQMDNFSIELEPAVKTTSKVKRTIVQDVVIQSTVEVYR